MLWAGLAVLVDLASTVLFESQQLLALAHASCWGSESCGSQQRRSDTEGDLRQNSGGAEDILGLG